MATNFDLSAMQLVARHRRAAVDHCVEALAHSCRCADAYCRLPACPKMKRVVIHTNICQRKNKGSCPVCKQLIAMCCYHAKNCKDTRCVVPFCGLIKQKIRRHSMFQRLRCARGLEPDEPDEIDVNILGGVSGWTWRMVRLVPSPNPTESADEEEGQAPEDNAPDADDIDSGESNVTADNNNVGENGDLSDTSSDGGPNEPTDSPDEKPANETDEKPDLTESE